MAGRTDEVEPQCMAKNGNKTKEDGFIKTRNRSVRLMKTLIFLLFFLTLHFICEKIVNPEKKIFYLAISVVGMLAFTLFAEIVVNQMEISFKKIGIEVPWAAEITGEAGDWEEDTEGKIAAEESKAGLIDIEPEVGTEKETGSVGRAENKEERITAFEEGTIDDADWQQTREDIYNVYAGIIRIYNALESNPVTFMKNSCVWLLENKWLAPLAAFTYRHIYGMGIFVVYMYALYLLILHKKVSFPEGVVFFLGIGVITTAAACIGAIKMDKSPFGKRKRTVRKERTTDCSSTENRSASPAGHGRVVDRSGKPYDQSEELKSNLYWRLCCILLVQMTPLTVIGALLKTGSGLLSLPVWVDYAVLIISAAVFQLAAHALCQTEIMEELETERIRERIWKICTLIVMWILGVVWLGVYFKYFA